MKLESAYALRLCDGLCNCGRALTPTHLRSILRCEAASGCDVLTD